MGNKAYVDAAARAQLALMSSRAVSGTIIQFALFMTTTWACDEGLWHR